MSYIFSGAYTPLSCKLVEQVRFRQNSLYNLFSSPVGKYRKSYCSHVGVSVGVGVALMLKFLVKVFISLYLLNMLMDYVETLHVGRYWSEVLFCTIMTHASDLEVKVTDLEILC